MSELGFNLFTWLSLVMSMMVSFVLSFFPRDVLDEILNLIGSVSEGFPSYSLTSHQQRGHTETERRFKVSSESPVGPRSAIGRAPDS